MNPTLFSSSKPTPVSSTHPPTGSGAGVDAPTTSSTCDPLRRSGQVVPSSSSSMPRKNQACRKQHKDQRRPGLGQRLQMSPDRDDAMAEIRALRNPNSRRGQTSITHLLDYSAPRPRHEYASYARSYRRNPTWGPGSGYHASDKARYVHANYRFVVSPDTTYSKHAEDADHHLDWKNVMQVIASSQSQVTSCPICLSDPVAPRMAKCGHIFCLSCLIRFMNSSSDNNEPKASKATKWKKCPICEDSIYLQDVRPVRFYAGQESPLPRVGDDVILRLIARRAHSTLALPRESGAEVLNCGLDIPPHFAASVLDYARIMMGSREYMVEQFDEEIATLKKQEKEDELLFGQDGEWSQKAIKAVNAAKNGLESLEDSASSSAVAHISGSSRQSTETDFYFYSAPPHLYLTPLDIRILKTKYGSFESFPSTLLPRVEHISTGHVVDDAMRKRAKYLGHLPRGCIISFLECDWTDIIPQETLDLFKDEIERRRKRHRDKTRQEDKERLQAERFEALELLGMAGTRRSPSPYYREPAVPSLDPSEFQPLNAPQGATMTSETNSGLEPLSTSPSTQTTIWGTRVAAPSSPELKAGGGSAHGPVNDGWLRDDDILTPAELAVQIAGLNAFDKSGGISGNGETSTVNGGGSSSNAGGAGGKKKKKQKITLMSTGGRRGI